MLSKPAFLVTIVSGNSASPPVSRLLPDGICSVSSKATWSSSGGHCPPEDIFSALPPPFHRPAPCLLWPPSGPVLKPSSFPFSFRFRSLKTTTISFVSLRNCRLHPQTASGAQRRGGVEAAVPRRRCAFRSLRLRTTTPEGGGRLQALAASCPRLSSVSFERSDS